MYIHASPFSRFLISCKAERDKAEGAANAIIKKMARKGRLLPVEKMLIAAFTRSSTSTAGKAFVEDARRHGYTEVEWTYTVANTQNGKGWNIEQGSAWKVEEGSAWNIEQGSAWTIEQGSAWKVEEGENWKVEWTEIGGGQRVPSPGSVAMITNSFVGAT